MTAEALSNGRVDAAEVPDPAVPDLAGLGRRTNALIDEVAGELRSMIMAEQTGRSEFEDAIAESRARERKLVRTLKALEGSEPAKPAPKPAKAKPGTRVSDERVEQIWQAFKTWSAGPDVHPISANAFGKVMREHGDNIGTGTMLEAFRILRERELVRPAGRGRTGGTTWALMPGVTDGA